MILLPYTGVPSGIHALALRNGSANSLYFNLMSAKLTALFVSSVSGFRHDVMSWNFHVSGASGLGISIAAYTVNGIHDTSSWLRKGGRSLTTDPCPDSVWVNGHCIEIMQASDVRGLLGCRIRDEDPGRYVGDGRRRTILGSYQDLPDARTRSICADKAGTGYFIAIGELCRYGVISWLDVQQALATLRTLMVRGFSSTPRLQICVNDYTCALPSGSASKSHSRILYLETRVIFVFSEGLRISPVTPCTMGGWLKSSSEIAWKGSV